jgi:hypothetical protein
MRHLSDGGVAGGVGEEGILVLELGREEAEGNDTVTACDETMALLGEDLACSEVIEEVAILEKVL